MIFKESKNSCSKHFYTSKSILRLILSSLINAGLKFNHHLKSKSCFTEKLFSAQKKVSVRPAEMFESNF